MQRILLGLILFLALPTLAWSEYTKTTWTNNGGEILNATNLNKIEQGIHDSHYSPTPNLKIVQPSQTIQSVIDSCPANQNNLYTVIVPPGHESEVYIPKQYVSVMYTNRSDGPLLFEHHTASDTALTVADCGKVFTNCGAVGDVTFTCPECIATTEGWHAYFEVCETIDKFLIIAPHDNDSFEQYKSGRTGEWINLMQSNDSYAHVICKKSASGAYDLFLRDYKGVIANAYPPFGQRLMRRSSENPFFGHRGLIRHVEKVGRVYHAFFEVSSGGWKIFKRYSTDGLNFTNFYPSDLDLVVHKTTGGGPETGGTLNGYDDGGMADPTILIENGTWHMWTDAMDDGGWHHLGYLTSPDGGDTWTNHGPFLSGSGWQENTELELDGTGDKPNAATVHHPLFIGKFNNYYYLIVCYDTSGSVRWDMGMVRTQTPSNLGSYEWLGVVLEKGSHGDFDDWYVRPGAIIPFDGRYYFLYWADDHVKLSIGMATTPDLTSIPYTKAGQYFTDGAESWDIEAQGNCVLIEDDTVKFYWVGDGTSGEMGLASMDLTNDYFTGDIISDWTYNLTAPDSSGLSSNISEQVASNYIYYSKVLASDIGSVDTLWAYGLNIDSSGIYDSSQKFKIALYTDDGLSPSRPSSLIANTTSVEITANDICIGGYPNATDEHVTIVPVAGTPSFTPNSAASYWIAAWVSSTGGILKLPGDWTGGSNTYAYTNEPETYGGAFPSNAASALPSDTARRGTIFMIMGPQNVWKKTSISDPGAIYFDHNAGIKQSQLSDLDANYEFVWQSNTLYVFSQGDPDKTFLKPGIYSSY